MQALPGNGTRYDETQGNMRLRKSIARFTYSWKGNLTEDDIVTTAGVTNAVALALSVITKVGDTIAVESPVYFGMLQLANSMGLRILELPTNPVTGIDPDALKKVLPQIKACLLISNFNNPLGSCMPDEHKRVVVDMLAGYDIPLIEDDLYGDLFFGNSRPKPCKAFDKKGLVLWCGAVSKTLAPGYRVGWIALTSLNMLLFAKRIFTLFLRLRLIKKRLPISWRMTDTKTIYVNCDKNYTQTVFILPIPSWITSPRIQKLLLHKEDLCFGWN